MPSTPDSSPLPLKLENVTIGVLTALEVECAACWDIFDPEHHRVEILQRATTGTLVCRLCHVNARHGGQHVVAILKLNDMGNNAAAIGGNILLQHCPKTRYLIMCGIAGAVPNPDKAEDHVRLGDIVVSNRSGIIQYDRGKQRHPQPTQNLAGNTTEQVNPTSDPFAGFEFRGPPRPPSPDLLDAVSRMHTDEELLGKSAWRCWETKIEVFLSQVGNREKWERPYHNKDRLIDSPDGNGTNIRHPRDCQRRKVRPPESSSRIVCPRVFRGPIGAANIVLADPNKRNVLREKHGIKAVEMEGSGVADAAWVANVGYLVVRGTCDYCNSTKNDAWHHYAALIAAAYTHTVIEYLPPVIIPPVGQATDKPQPSGLGGDHPHTAPPAVKPDINTLENSLEKLKKGSASGTRSQATTGFDNGHNEPAQHSEAVQFASEELARHVGAKASVKDITENIKQLIEEFRYSEISPLFEELEKQLRSLPRKGSDVREAWITLARVENQRLQVEKQAARAVDVTRLRALRQEAESVVD